MAKQWFFTFLENPLVSLINLLILIVRFCLSTCPVITLVKSGLPDMILFSAPVYLSLLLNLLYLWIAKGLEAQVSDFIKPV